MFDSEILERNLGVVKNQSWKLSSPTKIEINQLVMNHFNFISKKAL